jgi:hypothetical protein
LHFHASTAQNGQGAIQIITNTLASMPPTGGMTEKKNGTGFVVQGS